jgi:hypothetical protein
MPLTIINGPFIQAGESLSDAVDLDGGNLVRITMAGHWNGGNLTFQVSTDGELFNDLFDGHGNEITMVMTKGAAIPVLDLGGWTRMLGHLKIRSGTRSHPVVQDDVREFALTVETIDGGATASRTVVRK